VFGIEIFKIGMVQLRGFNGIHNRVFPFVNVKL